MQVGPANSYFHSVSAARSSGASPSVSASSASSGFAAALASVAAKPVVNDAQRYAPSGDSLLSHLTPADRELLQAATGFEISSDGTVMNPKYGESVDPMIMVVAMQREDGSLKGELTGEYLTGLFKQYAGESNMAASFNPDRLEKALDVLADRDARRAQGVRPSSFDVGI